MTNDLRVDLQDWNQTCQDTPSLAHFVRSEAFHERHVWVQLNPDAETDTTLLQG